MLKRVWSEEVIQLGHSVLSYFCAVPKDKSGVRFGVVDEGENLWHVHCDVSYWPEPDLVAVNHFAKLTASKAVSHDILERLCCLCRMLYRGRNRDDDASPLWQNVG